MPRALRLVGLALAGGAVAGMAAAGDIEASYRKGRVAPMSWAGAAPLQAQTPAGPVADHSLAQAHGFALAAQRRFDREADCRTVRPEFRLGCEDYVAQSRGSSADAAADLAFAG